MPDGQIAGGTPNPAIVPLPHAPLPPMPTKTFAGYPFYIGFHGLAGHRPPKPPLDLEGAEDRSTLQRHVILSAQARETVERPARMIKKRGDPACTDPSMNADLYARGQTNSACIAGRVRSENGRPDLLGLARELETAQVRVLPLTGTYAERCAMAFHAGVPERYGSTTCAPPRASVVAKPDAYGWQGRGYPTCDAEGECGKLFLVNGRGPQPGAPYADPCPTTATDAKDRRFDVATRRYRTAYVQLDLTVNKAGWHDPQARITLLQDDVGRTLEGKRPAEPLFFRARSGECIDYRATNLIPSNLNLDDFQVYSPTDVIGQHIHLVKFDVTSSDGSGNGWNYEDGALGADEIRERIAANNRYQRRHGGTQIMRPKTNPMFAKPSSTLSKTMRARGVCPDSLDPNAWEKAPWCGAETMISRWWADPLLNAPGGHPGTNDRTLRTVFTHDHFGPSSHQHHGLYAALVIEPSDARWEFLDGHPMGGASADNKPVVMPGHTDGGPTSYAANVIVPRAGNACVDAPGRVPCSPVGATSIDPSRSAREFGLAFADYAIVYTAANKPVNPPNRIETGLQLATAAAPLPGPEGISTKDPGTQLINYRNEPFPFRLGAFKGTTFAQPHDATGNVAAPFDVADVFSSTAHAGEPAVPSLLYPDDATVRESGDPATPILRAYDGDKVQLRLIQGAQEENHVSGLVKPLRSDRSRKLLISSVRGIS